MNDTSGPTLPIPFAYYDPDSRCLRTSQGILVSDSTPSSLTLPRSGLMRNGWLYERPTRVPRTAGSGCSSLLPTPTDDDTNNAYGRTSGQYQSLATAVCHGQKKAT